VPQEWNDLPREEQIARIKVAIMCEMSATYIDTKDIRQFLGLLANHTVAPWRHQFHTTNWDFLLQREVLDHVNKVKPSWIAETHVYHLNGTVENLPDNSPRSEFVLESDPPQVRIATNEGDIAYNKFVWSQTFVVVGMSFECEVDKYLLSAIKQVEDDLPIGDSCWIVLNPSASALSATCSRLRDVLPRAKIISRVSTFRDWLDAKLPELQSWGALDYEVEW
jgi:hypothetical protein